MAFTGIQARAASIAMIPLVGFIALAAMAISDRHDIQTRMESLDAQAAVVTAASELVHELQKERGATSVFVASGGKQMADAIAPQRGRSDEAQAKLRAVLGTQVDAPIFAAALKALGRMEAVREQISAMALQPGGVFTYYTGLIGNVLTLSDALGRQADSRELANRIGAYNDLLEAKERAGQERALGGALFALQRFDAELYQRFVAVVAEQGLFTDHFREGASPEELALFDEALAAPGGRQVLALRGFLLNANTESGIPRVDPAQWFKVATDRIDTLKKVEDALSQNLRTLAVTEHDKAQRAFRLLLFVVVGLSVAALVLSGLVVRSIVRPLTELARCTVRLAEGDSSQEVPALGRKDEIGAVARAVEVFKENQREMERMRAEQAAVRERDQAERHRHMLGLAEQLEGKVDSVVALVCRNADAIVSRAEAMGEKIDSTASRTLGMAEAAERTAASIGTVAAAAEQLSRSINEIAQRVATSSSVAKEAVDQTSGVNARVGDLAKAVSEIGDVVNLINDIASQTNLLALNATIEAARAGEAGKGFAVVAGEVKGLASQTARATEQISRQIAGVQSATAEAVASLAAVTRTIGSFNEIAGAIAQAVERQADATRDIAHHVDSVGGDAKTVQESVLHVTQAAASSYSGAIQVLWSATDLSEPTDRLRYEVDDFLRTVRAG